MALQVQRHPEKEGYVSRVRGLLWGPQPQNPSNLPQALLICNSKANSIVNPIPAFMHLANAYQTPTSCPAVGNTCVTVRDLDPTFMDT